MNIRSSAFRPLAAAILALAAALPCTALAVGTEFTWQGELRESGLPASGSYDFEFRLFAAATGGSPIGPVRSLPAQSITAGLYTALLDFGDQFTGEPRWLEISVRRAGQPTFTVLQPRQPLTATPYAQHADFVADNSIVGANIVDGSIGGADLALGAVSTTQIANGSVATVDLADGSVTTPKLSDAGVATVKLANGAVTNAKLAPAAVSTQSLADAAVTAAKIAPGAVGLAQVDANVIQRRITASCGSGFPLLAIAADGAPTCDDAVAFLGPQLSMPALALAANDDPLIVAIDAAAADLVVMRCTEPLCAGGSTRLVRDSDVGASTGAAVVRRGNGSLFIAYHDAAATDLHAFDCAGADCSAGVTFRSLDTDGDAGRGVDIALRAGDIPIISYLSATSSGPVLRVFDCADTGCSSGSVRTLDTTSVASASNTSVSVLSNGNPVVFYGGALFDNGLNAFVCSDPDCTSGVSYDLNNHAARAIDSAVRGSGLPIVSYRDASGSGNNDVYAFQCTGTGCSSGSSTLLRSASTAVTTAIAYRSNGLPVVAYSGSSVIRVYDCGTPSCTSGTDYALTSGPDVGTWLTMAVRGDDRVAIVTESEDPTGEPRLRLDVCGNTGCRQ